MPSPRQILIDISDMGLDPTVAHTQTSTAGSLRPAVEAAVVEVIDEPKPTKKEEPAKNALVEVQAEEPKKKEKKQKKAADVEPEKVEVQAQIVEQAPVEQENDKSVD